MFGLKIGSWIRGLLFLFLVGTAFELATPQEAQARAGRGRSSGRSSSYRPTPSPSQPNYSNPNFNRSSPAASPTPPPSSSRGGFFRSMAGGIAGGFLGSMLFSSIGNAAGGMGRMGGGIGLLEIALFAGLAYLAMRWWKNRQQAAAAMSGYGTAERSGSVSAMNAHSDSYLGNGAASNVASFRALTPSGIDSEAASDLFFKVQGAWTRRDLSSVRALLGREMQESLERDIEDLRRNHHINRLENISVRGTEVVDSWYEDQDEYSMVRFTASLLDYTVDERSGQVVEGSDASPVKFEEKWTFAKARGAVEWRLVGIEQV